MNTQHDVPAAALPSTVWCHDEPVVPLHRSVAEWRSIVMDAYATLPTLNLTRPQAERLWGMAPSTCGYVLDSLVQAGLLVRTAAGQYCRTDNVQPDAALLTI